MSLKYYPKSFVNPLLALAFKDGIEFVSDPDYKASEPRKEGDKWVVIVTHDDDDDDDEQVDNKPKTWLSPAKPAQSVAASGKLQDYETRLKSMKPINAQSSREIIHPPVKISAEDRSSDIRPCGECLPCRHGGDCLKIIEAACVAMSGRER